MRVKHSLKRLTSLLLCLVMLMQTVVVASAAGFNPKAETPEPTAADAFEFSKGTITDYVAATPTWLFPPPLTARLLPQSDRPRLWTRASKML